MNIYRKEDLSVYYFVQTIFSGYPFINIVDAYPDEILNIPTVSIETGKTKEEDFELGNREKLRVRVWYIDIFAKNKAQRDDLGYTLLANTNDGINVYDYDEGFPPDVSPSKIGHMAIITDSYEPIPVILGEQEKLYYRGQVILVTQNDTV